MNTSKRRTELVGALRRWGLGFAMMVGALAAQAGVVGASYSLGGDREGLAGEQVSLSVTESQLTDFMGGSLHFSFDANLLSFAGLSADTDCSNPAATICGQALADPGPGTFSLFLLTTLAQVSGADQLLFTLLFDINAAASPGAVDISFVNDLVPPVDDGIYDRQRFTGSITVLEAPNRLPIAGSAWLVVIALGALSLARRSHRLCL